MKEKEVFLPENVSNALGERVDLWKSLDATRETVEKIKSLKIIAGNVNSVLVENSNTVRKIDDVPGQINQTMLDATTQAEIITRATAELEVTQKEIANIEQARRNMNILIVLIVVILAVCLVLSIAGRIR